MKKIKDIIKLKRLVEKELLSRPNVCGVDVGYKYSGGKKTDEIAIRVFVRKKAVDLSDEEKIPKEISGIKTDIIEEEFKINSREYDRNVRADFDSYETLIGGMRIEMPTEANPKSGVFNIGTIGMIVKDKSTGLPLMLTNYHVVSSGTSVYNNSPIHQPEVITSIRNGSVDYSQREIGDTNKSFLGYHKEVFIDAATSNIDLSKSKVSNEILQIGKVKGLKELKTSDEGLSVSKRGGITRLTHGFIDGVDHTTNVSYSLGNMQVKNAFRVRPNEAVNGLFSTSGDSGSVVVDDNNKIVGLLFAGSEKRGTGLICPIQPVFEKLGIALPTAKDIKKWNALKKTKPLNTEPPTNNTVSSDSKSSKSFKEFKKYIDSLNLRFFEAHEFWFLGDKNNNPNSPAHKKNKYPPKRLWKNIGKTAEVLDELRYRLNAPIVITSAYRTKAYNDLIGGEEGSSHTKFNALDFVVNARSGANEWAFVLGQIRAEGMFKGGIGVYRGYVHIDTRGENKDWGNVYA